MSLPSFPKSLGGSDAAPAHGWWAHRVTLRAVNHTDLKMRANIFAVAYSLWFQTLGQGEYSWILLKQTEQPETTRSPVFTRE